MSARQNFNIAAYLPHKWLPGSLRLLRFTSRCRGKGSGKDYLTLTYRQLNQRSDQIAHGLESLGIGNGVRTCADG